MLEHPKVLISLEKSHKVTSTQTQVKMFCFSPDSGIAINTVFKYNMSAGKISFHLMQSK